MNAQAQSSPRHRRAHLRHIEAIFESSTDAIYLKDLAGRYLTANDAASRFFGRPLSEILGHDASSLFPPKLATEIMELERALVSDGIPRTFTKTYEVAGTIRHLCTTKYLARDSNGKTIGIACVGRDVTTLVEAEFGLRESESRERARRAEIATIMEAIPAAVFIAHDPLCRTMTGNRAVHELLQVPRDKSVSKSAPNDGAPRNFEAFRNGQKLTPEELPVQVAARTGQAVNDFELDLIFEDGAVHTIFGSALPLFDENGNSRGGVGAFVDITPYKRVQNELQSLNQEMESLLATVAHEFRNPLSALVTAIQLWKTSPDPDVWKSARQLIERQAAHLTRLAEDIVDASRIKTGKLGMRRSHIDLCSVLDDSVQSCSFLIERQGQTLTVDKMPGPFLVYGDAVRLVQVFQNLLHNGAKFTPRGGHIHVAGYVENSEVVVTVSDNGIGIEKDRLSHIFNLYSQVDPSPASRKSGLGIGLALVRELVSMHGGSIEVKSEGLGKGAEFIVRLPVSADIVEQ